MSGYDQFTPQPAVEVSPNWPQQPVSGEPDLAPLPPQFYQTPSGDTIIECAVCLTVGDPGDRTLAPFRAVTTVRGTALCRVHLNDYDDGTGGALHFIAQRIADEAVDAEVVDDCRCCCARLGPADCCIPCSNGGHSHCVGPLT